MPRIRLKDIAEQLGVSTQTVSLAMRGQGNLSATVRAKILALADELGYKQDPAMAALCAYRSQTRQTGMKWDRIALVHDWPSNEQWRTDRFIRVMIAGIEQAAKRRGLSIEAVWLGHCSEHAEREFRRLRHKGIQGVIVAPHSPEASPQRVPFDDKLFHTVTCGPEHLYTDTHTVQFDYYENLRTAWHVLRDKGFRRIGLVYDAYHDWRTGSAWLGAYYVETRLCGLNINELPPHAILDAKEPSVRLFEKWLAAHEPDAIITSSYRPKKWLTPTHHPYVAEMNPEYRQTPGININIEQMSEKLVDLLVIEMQRSLHTPFQAPYRVHIPGRWVEPEHAR